MSTAATAPIKTAEVKGRRQLHFDSLDDILADAERMAAQPVRCLGNWSFGQAMWHLARTMKMSIEGANFKAPWVIRLMAKVFKNRWLSRTMPAGFKLPNRAASDLLAAGPVSTEEGLAELRTMVGRLKSESQRAPSPVFGPLSMDDWTRLHCRHAELHLSFIVPQ